VVFFLRAVERADGWWVCKRGRADLGVHPTLDDALAWLDQLRGGLDGDVEIRVHRRQATTAD